MPGVGQENPYKGCDAFCLNEKNEFTRKSWGGPENSVEVEVGNQFR